MSEKIDLSLILACYNDALYLEGSMEEIFKVLEMTKLNYEIIFVYDCGTDNTVQIMENIIKRNNGVKHIKKIVHQKNKGRGKSVRDGMKIAEGDIVGYIDVDLDIHPRYIPSMVSVITDDGYDVATAFRFYKIQFNPLFIMRHVLSHGYRFISRFLLDERLKDSESGYKFFKREKIMPLVDISHYNGWFWDTEIMIYCIYNGLKINEVSCIFDRRKYKTSSVSIVKTIFSYFRSLMKFKRYLMRHKKEVIERLKSRDFKTE